VAGSDGFFNDLWEFNPTTKEWTWVSGSDTPVAVGVYGTQGVASASNVPGARSGSVSWTDSSGNLWLFAGFGFDSTGTRGILNDLWEFSPATKEWTWMGGSNTGNAKGVYGTLGTPAASNVPGARGEFIPVTWTDSSGNFWQFGGDGYDSAGALGALNDLWRYEP
jgi:N-acetylneuraminic acid mutarotase